MNAVDNIYYTIREAAKGFFSGLATKAFTPTPPPPRFKWHPELFLK